MKGSTATSIILLGFFLSTVSLLISSDGETPTANEIPAKSTVIAGTTTVEELLAEGNRHHELGQFEKAIEKFKTALSLVPDTHDTFSIVVLLASLGCTYGEVGRYQEASETLKQAVRIEPDFVGAYVCLGSSYGMLGRHQEAVEAFKQAIRLRPDLAETHYLLGSAYGESGRFQDEVAAYERAIQLKPDYLDAYYNLGLSYNDLGRYQEAMAAYRKAVQLKPDYVDAYYRLGLTYYELGRWQEAMSTFQEAMKIKPDSEAHLPLGHLLMQSGRLSEVLFLFQQQREIGRKLKNVQSEAAALNGLAMVSGQIGDIDHASEYSHQALVLWQQAGNPEAEAITLAQIGLWRSEKGQCAEALNFFHRALSKYQEAKDQKGVGFVLYLIGICTVTLGDYDQAILWLNKALEANKQASTSRESLMITMLAFSSLGETYVRLKREDDALKVLQRAETITQLLSPVETYPILQVTGRVREAQGRFPEALALYTRAVEAHETLRRPERLEVVKIVLQERASLVYQDIIRLLFKLYTLKPGQHYVEQAFLYHERGKARALLDLLEEARLRVREGIDPALLKEEEEITIRISRTHRALANEISQEKKKQLLVTLTEQEQARQTLRVKMAVTNPKYAELTSPQAASIQQVQALLDKETLLLEYALGKEKSFLWSITRDSMHAYELPAAEEITRQVEQYRPTLRAPLIGKDEIGRHIELGKDIYRMLLQPAASQLKEKTKLVIVPDGGLYYLPFETLIADDEGSISEENKELPTLHSVSYLVKNYTVTYAPSASVLVTLEKNRDKRRQEKASAQTPLLAFGDPLYETTPQPRTVALNARSAYEERGGGFKRLEHSAKEVEKIAEIYEITLSSDAVNLREKATEKNLREVDLTRYRILHFATHAILSDEVKWITQPALVLSLAGTDETYDGFLQMGEIFNLRLDADLVVLSACDTGKGKLLRGEGIVGLTRAFMYAGTPSVVASLWKVNDQSTSLFMEFFYRNLKEGQSKAEALRQAKKQLMQTQVWSDTLKAEQSLTAPYFWAPFILVGSGD